MLHLSLILAIVIPLSALLIIIFTLLILLNWYFIHFRDDVHGKDETSELERAEKSAKGDTDQIPQLYNRAEVELLTGNFGGPVVGQGGFSTVYLGTIPGCSERVAVKIQKHGGVARVLGAFRQELELLRKIRHPNIVRIRGFSEDHEEEGALILEYLPNGTLHEKLHTKSNNNKALPWRNRTRILFDLADAIEHLHAMDPPVIHNDITSTNVLLDSHLRPRLCDFGSASAGFSAAVTRSVVAVGSPGYADPYYLRTGLISKKTDVYSFGVLVLEVVTGLPVVGSDGRNLTARILPWIERRLMDFLDPRLDGEYDFDEAVQITALAVKCTGPQPGLRPSMMEIRSVMREHVRSGIVSS